MITTTDRPPEVPTVSVRLEAGDLLYLPFGWWHEVHAHPDEKKGLCAAVSHFYHPYWCRLGGPTTTELGPNGQPRTAVYLPDVIPEQGWSKAETIDSLVRKSGYQGAINEALRSRIKVTRYKSTKHSVSYEAWQQVRGHAGAGQANGQP